MTGGVASAQADIVETPERTYDVSGDVRVDHLELRGHPASASMAIAARWDPHAERLVSARAERIALKGPGIDLGGTASVTSSPTRVRFDLRGPLLALNQLLSALPSRPSTSTERVIVPADWRRQVGSVGVDGTLHINRVVNGRLTLSDFDASTALERGLLKLEGCRAKVYQGTIDMSGSTVDLDAPQPAWHLVTRMAGVDVAEAAAALTDQRWLEGKFGGNMELNGSGNDWPELRKTLTGNGQATIETAALPREFEAKLAEPVRSALSEVGLGETARRALAETRWAENGRMTAKFTIADGWVRLTGPLRLQMPFGTAELNGRVGLDRRLDLSGKLGLAPEFVQKLTGGRLSPNQPVDLPLRLAGTMSDPKVDIQVEPTNLGRGAEPAPAPKVPAAPNVPAPQAPQVPKPPAPHLPGPPVPPLPAMP